MNDIFTRRCCNITDRRAISFLTRSTICNYKPAICHHVAVSDFKNGVIQGSLLALNYMGKHNGGKGGTIVNISSITGLDVFPTWPVYCSSKHAVLTFSRCLQVNNMLSRRKNKFVDVSFAKFCLGF